MSDSVAFNPRRIAILGVRGVPAAHGGFETFAARLAPYLAASGLDVTVYCQEEVAPPENAASVPSAKKTTIWESQWEGVTRVHIAVGAETPVNSIRFDSRCISHVLEHRPDAVLILGYNTAIFALRLRLAKIPTVINMDGLEWARAKWGKAAKLWLYANERAGCRFAHHLIADHPQIESHLRSRVERRKISVIPYGADPLQPDADTLADAAVLSKLGVSSGQFATIVARAEPENSILEMIRAFSVKQRGINLLVLGKYHPHVKLHAQIQASASAEVLFPGAIYEKSIVKTLRQHCLFYMHGHRVGGCNPSLLEAMGAGNAVLAHDNPFNRWVVRDGALYFSDQKSCEDALDDLLLNGERVRALGPKNLRRSIEVFNWPDVLHSYKQLLNALVDEFAPANANTRWGYPQQWQLDADAP